jgi:phosphatidylserine decarboxylase
VAGLLADLAIVGLVVLAAVVNGWFLAPLVIVVLLWGWVLWFFRDPDRTPAEGGGVLLSPADGHVADVTPVGPDSALGCSGVKIGIFMSVFDVHVNRSPGEARVVRTEHADGVYLDARDPDAAFRNESTTIHLIAEHGGREYPLVVRQIAGLIARRIVTDLREGQELAAGERIGMIKFGSRVELIVPDDPAREVRVRVGEKVRAGQTVLMGEPEVGE